MNEKALYEKLKDESLLNRAIIYAMRERLELSDFCNFFELRFYRNRSENLKRDIKDILSEPDSFQHSTCFAYYFPKNKLCIRRFIYLPFKELVLRYLFVTLICENTDYQLSEQCFAHRKASKPKLELFEDYVALHTKFTIWQELLYEDKERPILVKADISSFFDTVTHEYLIQTISSILDIDKDSKFISLFRKLFQFKVVGYSFVDKQLFESNFMQGLTIGNKPDSYLANLYLKDLDEALEKLGIDFGRYVDDIRIFSDNTLNAIHCVRILQEFLLKRGLNLNSAKTQIFEDIDEGKDYVKKSKILGSSYDDSSSDEIDGSQVNSKARPIDSHLKDEVPKDFVVSDEIENEYEAKIWAKYLMGDWFKPNNNFDIRELCLQVKRIPSLMLKFPSISKLCTWLVVQFAFFEYPKEISQTAYKVMLEVLDDEGITPWAKSRVFHHLIKPRKGAISYLKRLTLDQKLCADIKIRMNQLISYPSIELQLNILYAFYEIHEDKKELITVIKEQMPKPIPSPLNDTIFQLDLTVDNDENSITLEDLEFIYRDAVE